jgi:hypothetical protein
MATALVIGALPYTNTQDLTGVTPIGTDPNLYALWYQLPASLVTGGAVIGARGQAVDLGGSAPFVYVVTYVAPPVGAIGSPYLGSIGSNTFGDGRIQIPLASTPQDYYFRVVIEDYDPAICDVTFTCYAAPANQAIPVGSILINSDEPGYPAAALAVGTGEILAFVTMAAGETGDILPTGRFLLAQADGGPYALYAPTLALLTTVPLTGGVGSGNQVDTFYAVTLESGQTWIRAIDQTGSIGTRWGPIPSGTRMLAVSRDETRAYLTADTGPVRQWDLVNDVALADFAAAIAGYNLSFPGLSPGGILVLADGSVLVNYFRSTGADYFVRRYSSAGATLHTYVNPAGTALDRIAHDPTDDGATFWVWWKSGGTSFGLGRIERIRVSDGAVLSTTIAAEVWEGAQLRVDANLHSNPFGYPYSCPFLITRVSAVPPYGGGGTPPIVIAEPGSYGITGAPTAEPASGLRSSPQRRLRRAPHLADEQRWLTYDRFQLDLQTGVGLVTGQGSDPQVMLRWSNDGGHTWSNEHWVSAGRMGATKTRAIWRQLGRARTRTFEVVVSDPVRWYIAQALVDVSPGDGT